MPGIWKHLEARRQTEYERRKVATQKATAIRTEHEENLRRKMEDPQNRPPEKLSKKEMLLIAEKYRKKRKLLSLAR